MTPLAPEGLPPARGQTTAPPRVRLYLFEPRSQDPHLDVSEASSPNHAPPDVRPERSEGPELRS